MADKDWQEIADECEALAAIVNLAPMHAAARAVREQADEIERLRAESASERKLADDLFAVLRHLQPLREGAWAQHNYLEARRG